MSEFPVAGILPKEETGAARLLAENPHYDGRGQIIAVLDQGVDPGADGLRTTTQGKPKVVDIIDTTGSGDVDTSKQVTTETDSDGNHFITGLSGRKLIIPDSWNNTTQTWNIGIIDLTRIFPSYLKARMAKEQKEKHWAPQFNPALGEALKKVNDLEKLDVTQLENLLTKESAKAECEHLKKLGTDWSNKYYRTDLIIWTEEDNVKGCLDSSFTGDLSLCKVMADYSVNQEWHCLSTETCLNYSFKIFSPALCSVVCPSGSHGTHVAGIAAAYHPESPGKNGVAPGAQILSIKIGDSRLDTLETQAGLIRAIRAAVQAGCHIANYSYGEPCRYAMKGAIARELKEAFLKHHLLFVTSAGNSGPALTTVGAPASLTDYAMSIGAYAAPSTHCPIYSMRSQVPEVHYTWSSRGPSHDGAQGVAVSAPGVAITAVPTATLQNNQLMNGTSMASPNAAGAVALALSSIDSSDRDLWAPASVKRAFMNSARSVPGAEKETQGCGLIQVDRAVQILPGCDRTHYNLKTSTGQRGIYLREPYEVNTKRLVAMAVKAEHPDNMSNEDKIAFEKHCIIKNSHPWISAPQFLHLSSGEKAFGIEVDPTQIAPGSYRSERLDVVESGNNHKVLFNIPITVVRPLEVAAGETISASHQFTPGDIKRMFYHVPNGTTYCSVTIDCLDAPARYMFHAVQLQRGRPFVELNEELFLNLSPKNASKTFSFKVQENGTLELTMARFWSSDGYGGAKWDIKFGGVIPSSQALTLTSSPVAVELTSSVAEMTSPMVRLEKLCMPLNPIDHTISTLDELPYDKPLNESLTSYRARINYSFALTTKGEIWIEVPLLNGLLYESDYTETLVHVFDSNNKMVHTCEVLKLSKTKQTLDKGDYKLVVYLSSTNRARLESSSKALIVNVLCKLSKIVKVDAFWSQEDAIVGVNKNKDKMVRANEPVSLYLGPSMTDLDQPDLSKADGGRTLIGTMKLSKVDQNKKVENFDVSMTLLPRAKPKKDTPPKAEKDNSIENLERETRVAWVKAGHGQIDHFNKTKELYPTHVPLYHARLQFLTKDAKDGKPVATEECEQVCAEILNIVDLKNVIFETQRKGKLTAEETKVKDAATEEKAAWILAKVTSIRAAIASMNISSDAGDTGDGDASKQAILKQLKELQQLIDFTVEDSLTKDVQIIRMNIELGRALELHGWELKNLSRLADISATKEISQRISVVYSRLSWSFAEQYQLLATNENFPHAQLFI